MKNNKNARYILLDTEASGFYPHKNGLLEVAALALDDFLNVVSSYNAYIKPPVDIEYDPVSMEINGISLATIESGVSYQVFCEEFLKFIEAHFEGQPIAVAQFFPFDSAYLNYVFEYCGYNKQLTEILGNDFVDTKSMVNVANMRARLKGEELPFPITSLSKSGGLKDILDIPKNGHKAHTAMGDVLATRDVLLALLNHS